MNAPVEPPIARISIVDDPRARSVDFARARARRLGGFDGRGRRGGARQRACGAPDPIGPDGIARERDGTLTCETDRAEPGARTETPREFERRTQNDSRWSH